MKLTAFRVPAWVHARAVHLLNQYQHQRVRPCRMLRTGHLSLKVNRRWRLLSRDGGITWELTTHEKYNGAKDRL